MEDSYVTAIIVAMINGRYIIQGKDNEKTAKEVVKIKRMIKRTMPESATRCRIYKRAKEVVRIARLESRLTICADSCNTYLLI